MSYALESEKEFQRLEAQSNTRLYEVQKDLRHMDFPEQGYVLDAGCGSGILARQLARSRPDLNIHGCDFSLERTQMASDAAKREFYQKIRFEAQDLTRLDYQSAFFDRIICRFVLEHLPITAQMDATHEFLRTLKPGGKLLLVDIDGMYFNIFPQTELISEFLNKLSMYPAVDLHVGRKLPHLLATNGFDAVKWKIETLQMRGKNLKTEARLLEERFEQTLGPTAALLGSEKRAKKFQAEYLATLKKPGSVLFYNKFIVTAQKRHLHLIK